MNEVPTIKLLRITAKAKKQYMYDVKNNDNEDYETIKKKLTRNFLLGELHNENEQFIFRRFGNMIISVDKTKDQIVNVANYRGEPKPFNVNLAYKEQLEYILGLR